MKYKSLQINLKVLFKKLTELIKTEILEDSRYTIYYIMLCPLHVHSVHTVTPFNDLFSYSIFFPPDVYEEKKRSDRDSHHKIQKMGGHFPMAFFKRNQNRKLGIVRSSQSPIFST